MMRNWVYFRFSDQSQFRLNLVYLTDQIPGREWPCAVQLVGAEERC